MQFGPILLASTATLLATGALRAQYEEGFDSQTSSNVIEIAESDSTFAYVDYSNMTIGAATFSIPEAPRQIPGTAPTRGVVMQCNLTAGLPNAINFIAADAPGGNPIVFGGRYRLSFDCYQHVTDPLPAVGSTEQLLWGVGIDNVGGMIMLAPPIEARHNRTAGTFGIWGWLAGENGYGTEDAAIFQDGTELADLGDQVAGEGVFFDEAFDAPTGSLFNAPANQWVRVDIDVDINGDVRVYYNGIEFFNQPGLNPTGYAMIGFEDPFNSLGSDPDNQWALFDNFRVITPAGACPLPGDASITGSTLGTTAEILNGSATPAIGCPMSVRLRGAPASQAVLLAIGGPAGATIPFPTPNCTLGLEIMLPPIANLIVFADALGNSGLSIHVPNDGSFCGLAFGFQYFWADSTACGIAHTEGLSLTIGQ